MSLYLVLRLNRLVLLRGKKLGSEPGMMLSDSKKSGANENVVLCTPE
jgi:hypothetical protein